MRKKKERKKKQKKKIGTFALKENEKSGQENFSFPHNFFFVSGKVPCLWAL